MLEIFSMIPYLQQQVLKLGSYFHKLYGFIFELRFNQRMYDCNKNSFFEIVLVAFSFAGNTTIVVLHCTHSAHDR